MEPTAPTPHVRRPPDHPPTNPPCPPHCRAPRAGAHTHAHYVSKSGIQHGAGAHRCVNRRPQHWHHPPYPDVVHGDHGLSCACVFANAEGRAHRPQRSRSAASGTYCVSCVISCVAVCREGGANARVPGLALTMTYLQGVYMEEACSAWCIVPLCSEQAHPTSLLCYPELVVPGVLQPPALCHPPCMQILRGKSQGRGMSAVVPSTLLSPALPTSTSCTPPPPPAPTSPSPLHEHSLVQVRRPSDGRLPDCRSPGCQRTFLCQREG